MESIGIEKLIKITKGELLLEDKNIEIIGIEIDSRKIKKGDLYIPIVGEKNNGHDFIEKAFENGGEITLTQEKNRNFPQGMVVIYVESTLAAMKAIADFHRHRFDIPLIAITGSSGKTTTKDLVAAVLSERFNTLKTQGNFNNEYGIPQTLFQLNHTHEIGVIEMGMDHLGDISKSIHLVEPDIGVITNIGLTHIEILKTQENIFKAKKEILETLNKDGIALVNGDDVFLKKLLDENHEYQIETFGIYGECDFKADRFKSHSRGLEIFITWKGNEENFYFEYPGEHNVYNMLVAIWLGFHFGMSPEEIQRGLNAFIPSGNRMDIFDVGTIKVINDSYNANPDAMKSALDVLGTMKVDYKRSIGILGDMLEMGDYAKDAHFEVGSYAKDAVDILISVGELGKEIGRGFSHESHKEVFYVENAQEAGKLVFSILQPEDIILIKASRGIGLEKTIEYIKGEKK